MALNDLCVSMCLKHLFIYSFLSISESECFPPLQIPEGHQAIQEARELRETHIKDKTKDMHLLDGMIKRLYSRFLRLPSCQLGEPAPASTAIDMAHEAVRQHTGVANFVFGNDLSGQSLLVVQPDTGE